MGRGGTQRIAGIVVDFLANTAGFDVELKKSEAASAKFARSVQTQFDQAGKSIAAMRSHGMALQNTILGLAGAGGLGALVKMSLDYADSIAEQSDALGMTAEAYQRNVFAASQAGITQEKFVQGFTKFLSAAEGAAEGDKGPAAVFKRLNVAVTDSNGNLRDSNDILNDVVVQLGQIPTKGEQLKIIADLFGARTAQKWAATFSGGKAGLEAMRKEADQLGIVMSDHDVQAGSMLSDSLDAIGGSMKSAFATGLIQGLTGETKDFDGSLKDMKPTITAMNRDIASIGRTFGHLLDVGRELEPIWLNLAQHPLAIAGAIAGGAVLGPEGALVGGLTGALADEAAAKKAREDNEPPPGMEGPAFPGRIWTEGETGPAQSNGKWTGEAPADASSAARRIGAKPNAAAEKAASDAEKAQKRIAAFVNSLKAEVAGLEQEADASGKSAEAQKEAALQKELLIDLTDKGIKKGSEEAQQIEDLLRRKQAAEDTTARAAIVRSLDEESQAMEGQIAILGLSTREQAAANAMMKIALDLKKQGLTLTDDELAAAQKQAAHIGDLAKLQADSDKARNAAEAYAQRGAQFFEDLIFNIKDADKAAKALAEDLARMFLQQKVLQPLVDAAGNWAAGLGKTAATAPTKTALMSPPGSTADFPGAAKQIVNITPPAGHQAQVRRRTSGGGQSVDVLIEQITAAQSAATARGGGFTPLLAARERRF